MSNLEKNSDNAYKSELSENFDISLIFNIADLYEFHEGEETTKERTMNEWKVQLPVKENDEIENILETTVNKRTSSKECLEYLIK